MCMECAHVIQFSAISAAGVLAYLHRFLRGPVTPRHLIAECDIASKCQSHQSQESQVRMNSFQARRSEAEPDGKEVFSPSTVRCAGEKLLERRVEPNEDAQSSTEAA